VPAGQWGVYDAAKGLEIDFDDTRFQMLLCDAASNAATRSLSAVGELTNELPEINGYLPKLMVTRFEPDPADVSRMLLSAEDVSWQAVGGNIEGAAFAVIAAATGELLCQCSLGAEASPILSGRALFVSCRAGILGVR
jgi:hypothetical protein